MLSGEWDLPKIDQKRCNRCGACIDACHQKALKMGKEGVYFFKPLACTYCADCEPVCPLGAIRCEFSIIWGEDAP